MVTLPHRELAQILRRAGNTLRLTIVPRPSTCELRLRSVAVDSSSPSSLSASAAAFSPQTRPAFQNPLSSTRVTGAERVRGRVQR